MTKEIKVDNVSTPVYVISVHVFSSVVLALSFVITLLENAQEYSLLQISQCSNYENFSKRRLGMNLL